MCDTIDRLKPVISWRLVSCIRPTFNLVKVKTDGSYIPHINRAGMGGVIRNHKGDLIMAFSVPLHCNSNNQIEAAAANYGAKWYIQNRILNFNLELDSLIISNMIKEEDTTNLKLRRIITYTSQLMKTAEVTISHCYREANQVAYFLAKMASMSGNSTFYYSFQQLPKEVKGVFQLDKCQLSSIRRRYDKCNFFVS